MGRSRKRSDLPAKKCVEFYKKKDARGILGLYANESSTFVFGTDATEMARGWDQLKTEYEKDFVEFPMIKKWENKLLSCASEGNVAWFAATVVAQFIQRNQPPLDFNARWTGVAKKINGKWLFVQGHFSTPRAGAEPEATAKAEPKRKSAKSKKRTSDNSTTVALLKHRHPVLSNNQRCPSLVFSFFSFGK